MSTDNNSQMTVSVRDDMVQVADGQSFFDAFRALDMDSFEMSIGIDGTVSKLAGKNGAAMPTVDTDEGIAGLKALLAAEGVTVCALLLATDFSADNAADHVAFAVNAVKVAQALGVPVIRIDPLTHIAKPIDEVRDNFIARIREVLDATKDSGIDLGIENHGGQGNNPAFLDAIFAAVPDRRLGMTLDTGNFYWSGMSLTRLYETLEHFAPRARHTHVKNIGYPAEIADTEREIGYEYGKYCIAIDEGSIDMRRVVGILKKAGYKRSLCIENESLGRFPFEERIAITRREGALLRTILAEQS